MNLKQLRGFVANILDYDPDNDAYIEEIDALLNAAQSDLFALQEWPFAEKTADVLIYADDTADDGTVTLGSTAISTTAAFFLSWHAGQVIEIEGVEYEVASVTGTTTANITDVYQANSVVGTASFTVKQRYVDMPADCDVLLEVGSRSGTAAQSSNPGHFFPFSRRLDEEWELPLDEVGTPDAWVPFDDTYIPAPVMGPSAVAAVAGGPPFWAAGDYSFKIAYKYAGRYSALSDAVNVQTAPGTNILQADLTGNSSGLGSGYKLSLWVLDPGYRAYRIIVDDVVETGAIILLSDPPSSDWFSKDRPEPNGGVYQRIRLHPRQSSDGSIQIRYKRITEDLVENVDSPHMPPPYHQYLAYRALETALSKHEQATLSNLYAGKADKMLTRMENAYTRKPRSRRWVKRGMFDDPLYTRNKWGPLSSSG